MTQKKILKCKSCKKQIKINNLENYEKKFGKIKTIYCKDCKIKLF